MVFLFTSTTIIYFLMLILMVISIMAAFLIDESYILLICIGLFAVAFIGIIVSGRIAVKKYNKTLLKLNYDVYGFLNEQYKFFNKMLITRNIRNLIETNIVCGFINNEQYNEALKILSEFEVEGYQGFTAVSRFIIFINQADCYIALENAERARPYIQNSELILRTAKFPDNLKYELSLIFENEVAMFNYKMNPNPQTAQNLIEKISARLDFAEKNGKQQALLSHYRLGVMYTIIGDTMQAEGEFDYILRTGAALPCVERIKAYNETGDTDILKL